ncbi:hypothetical protein PAHAL_4G066000 [Panicum hallii]|uniref:Uncharacterized protein n=1 Tax=Panicum hallii TaxID=206008 RepID=A0A2T8JC13_9POAL|nr:hypothetical protein PAHAL_4G066000 [Panicum hallii]
MVSLIVPCTYNKFSCIYYFSSPAKGSSKCLVTHVLGEKNCVITFQNKREQNHLTAQFVQILLREKIRCTLGHFTTLITLFS